VVRNGNEYLMFFSSRCPPQLQRTLSIARTGDLDAAWTIDLHPILRTSERVKNSFLYFEASNCTWSLFTNHIGSNGNQEFPDAIWVYWSQDLNHWDPANKAVVLDGRNCTWSRKCIGVPSVIRVGDRLALFSDAPGGTSHINRDQGLAWLPLVLRKP